MRSRRKKHRCCRQCGASIPQELQKVIIALCLALMASVLYHCTGVRLDNVHAGEVEKPKCSDLLSPPAPVNVEAESFPRRW